MSKEKAPITYNLDEVVTISKNHINELTKNRLLRILLTYLFVNSSASLSFTEIRKFFKKHNESALKKNLKRLIELGYINEAKKNYFQANGKYIYYPQTKDFE